MLEGSPGVGKTSLVQALANATGHPLTRINLSEQTVWQDIAFVSGDEFLTVWFLCVFCTSLCRMLLICLELIFQLKAAVVGSLLGETALSSVHSRLATGLCLTRLVCADKDRFLVVAMAAVCLAKCTTLASEGSVVCMFASLLSQRHLLLGEH